MNRIRKRQFPPLLVFLGAALALFIFAGEGLAQQMPEALHGASVAPASHLPGNSADDVGSETCAGCHSAEADSFAKTVHAPREAPKAASTKPAAGGEAPGVTGCETCHGPGRAHAEAEGNAAGDAAKELAGTKLIFSFHASAKENSQRCLVCHVSSHGQDSFAESQHAAAGISCTECHTPHLVKEVKDGAKANLPTAQAAFFQAPQLAETTQWLHGSLLKDPEPHLCFSCHGTVQAEFAQPIHHRVPEGLMKCSDCHNPHGSINRASLNATQWEACFKCHMEKRGPYVYEHAAVRVEGCAVCHNPHGSTNHFMLVRREGRQLCLQCHTGFHAQSGVPHSRLGFQDSGECTRCHVSIHGSQLDPDFLR